MALPFTASGEETRVFFGEDGQIKIKTEQVKREKIVADFLSKTEKLHLIQKITVQNLRKTAVSIDVSDRLPVSQNSKIEVTNVSLLPAPAKKEANGILSWILSLAPQEKKEITLDYTIEYPKDARITGLSGAHRIAKKMNVVVFSPFLFIFPKIFLTTQPFIC